MRVPLIVLICAWYLVAGCGPKAVSRGAVAPKNDMYVLPADGEPLDKSLKKKDNVIIGRPDQAEGDACGVAERSPEVIAEAVWEKVGAFQFCYEQASKDTKKLKGRVTISFVIEPAGNVTGATVTSASIKDEGLKECVRKQFETLVFQETAEGSLSVTFPVVFSATKSKGK